MPAEQPNRLSGLGRWLTRPLESIAALLLLLLMLLTCADVAGRYLFLAPVHGATELTRLLMAGIIFAALPVVSRREDHINVDLLDGVLPAAFIPIRQITINVICAAAMGVICRRVWILAERARQYGDRTEFLQIPVYPVSYFISLMCAVTALIFFLNTVSYLRAKGAAGS